jgi:hypothetical protein
LDVSYGSQGGQHVFVALRVTEPDPDHDRYQAVFRLQVEDRNGSWNTQADRSVVFTGSDGVVGKGGSLELAGLVLQLPSETLEEPARLVLDLRDSCDNAVHVEHVFRW